MRYRPAAFTLAPVFSFTFLFLLSRFDLYSVFSLCSLGHVGRETFYHGYCCGNVNLSEDQDRGPASLHSRNQLVTLKPADIRRNLLKPDANPKPVLLRPIVCLGEEHVGECVCSMESSLWSRQLGEKVCVDMNSRYKYLHSGASH